MKVVVVSLICVLIVGPVHAVREQIALRHVRLDLPGPPARVLSTDLNGDGRRDLLVIVAYTEIEQISEDLIEEMIQITRVIPTLFDRREMRAYLATERGDYRQAGPPLDLPVSVLHMEVGPPGVGLIALTDDGLSAVRFDGAGLSFEPLIAQRPILSRTRRFFPNLQLVHDLDGDGIDDVMLPTDRTIAIYLGDGSGLSSTASQFVPVPRRHVPSGSSSSIRLPLPSVEYVDGDDLPDLVFRGAVPGYGDIDVYLGTGEGRFRPLRQTELDCHDRGTDLRLQTTAEGAYPWPANVTAIQDLDGDRRAEVVIQIEQERGDSWRKEMKDAKKPIHDYSFYRLAEDRALVAEPYFRTRILGYTMEDDFTSDDDDPGSPFSLDQFIDLDGDGRDDLVTVTLAFSILQVLKILTTKKVGIGINFHVYAQQTDGSFREVPDLDLSEKLKLNLHNLEIGRFGQFAGDFDGDGRQDFVHLGRGRQITVHRGQAGCHYPKKPDLVIELDEEPPSLDLIRIEDLDGDGRADIRITRPLISNDPDLTAPVRLDLYLSGPSQ